MKDAVKYSFLIYSDYEELFKKLKFEQVGELMLLLIGYVKSGNIEQINDPLIDLVFTTIRLQIDRDKDKYKKIVERNKLNGSNGGRPKKPKKPSGLNQNPKKPKETQQKHNDNDNDNEFTNVNKKKSEKENFSPPTLFEVEEYFDTNGFDRAVAFRAYNGYAVADWVDSKGNRIRNWKQKMQQVWFKPEHQKKQVLAELDADEVAKFYGR